MLIPPSYFLERKWLRTALFSTDALKRLGISRSTYERLFKCVDFHCSSKTHTKLTQVWIETKCKLGLADRPIGWRFDLSRPWRTFFSDLIPNAVDSRDHKLSYAIHVMLQVEDALFAFGQQYREHNPQTTDLFLAMGLPDGILPREIENYLAELVAAQEQGLPRPSYPAWLGKATLRTFLFVLAAWEVTILRAKIYVANTEPFIHKCLPKMADGKLALPIKRFFEGIQDHYGLKTNKELVPFVEVSTIRNSGSEPEESALRQIQAWKAGEVPSLETIKNFAFKLVPDDGRQQKAIVASYIKNRLVQEVYVDCAALIGNESQCFTNVAELVALFQEYAEWYAHHEARYGEWLKQGAP